MPTTQIDSAAITDFSSKTYADTAAAQDLTKYPSKFTTDDGEDVTQSEYQNTRWSVQWGAYLQISEYGGMIDRKAQYVVGKGFKIPGVVGKIKEKVGMRGMKDILDKIRGNGKQTFNGIMYNGVRVYTLGGDFYAEIIRDGKEVLKNLKPLNPSTVKVIASDKGIIKEYKINPINVSPIDSRTDEVTLEPEDMFHLMYNPIADQIHGQSV